MTDQLRQAAQQALEALEHHSAIKHPQQIHYRDTAIAALKAALEQQAEPPPEWPLIKNILAVFGLDAIAFVAAWKAAQQQAELTCPECKAAVLYECVACSSNNYPPQQQAEPVAKLFGSLPVYDTTPPQRKELSASEILNMMPSGIPAEYDGPLMEFARAVEAKLKEKNT